MTPCVWGSADVIQSISYLAHWVLEDVQVHQFAFSEDLFICQSTIYSVYLLCEYIRAFKLGLVPWGSCLPDEAPPRWDRPSKQTILKISCFSQEGQSLLALQIRRYYSSGWILRQEPNNEMSVSHTSHSQVAISDLPHDVLWTWPLLQFNKLSNTHTHTLSVWKLFLMQ